MTYYSVSGKTLELETARACKHFFPAMSALQSLKTESCVVTLADIQAIHENTLTMLSLLKFLKVVVPDYSETHPVNDNLAYAQYKSFSLAFCSRPALCLYQKRLQVVIGSDSGTHRSTAIPLIYENNIWMLNGNRVSLDSYEFEGEQGKIKVPLLVVTPQVAKGKKADKPTESGIDFNKPVPIAISIKLQNGVDFITFKNAFETGDLDEVSVMVAPLFSAVASFSNVFAPLFNSNIFPRNGIIFKVVGKPSRNVGTFNGKTLVSYRVNVDFSELPPILANSMDKDQAGNKITTQIPITEIGSLYVSESSTLGQYLGNRADEVYTKERPLYVWVQSMANQSTHTPKHQVFSADDFDSFGLSEITQSMKPALLRAANQMVELNYDENPI